MFYISSVASVDIIEFQSLTEFRFQNDNVKYTSQK